MRSITVKTAGQLRVEIYGDRAAMGAAAAQRVAGWMAEALADQERVVMVFAAAPSQNEFLHYLGEMEGLGWSRVVALHMDEYTGLSQDHPQSFGYFLRRRLFDRVQPGTVHYLDGAAPDPATECRRYAALLAQKPVDIVCAGIGENGHLAFNDPPVADFHDPWLVKVVELDRPCREQQVHDGCFPTLADVPTLALTLTIPALMGARHISCVVPGSTKTEAVAHTLHDPIATTCPATILRTHPQAVLFLDVAAAGEA
ncbi:MAG: glucosamine-6-phosphate deaminase [Chloroflexi bacterium]|nr:glucosamine-6-phosphate deaminase [Chloroflexota bacterium]